jgi:hypothetical protein
MVDGGRCGCMYAEGYGAEGSWFPLMSRPSWLAVLSYGASLGSAECGDAVTGEYSSLLLGELKPDKGCVVGDVGLEGYDGPAGRRAGPSGGVDPLNCCRGSVTAVLRRLFAARSCCWSWLLARVDVLVSVSNFDRLPSGMVTILLLKVECSG